jgi:thymidine phosphorylase
MTPVNLSPIQIQEVVRKEGGCMVWGGALGISPSDDIIIRVERSLDIDPEAQMIASVLSKKIAIGATHVVIDIPVGPTAKIRSEDMFEKLKKYFCEVGNALGLYIDVMKTIGAQPLGVGIGPSLEAKDILTILRNEKKCAVDLKYKSLQLAGILLELGEKVPKGKGIILATELLENGMAFKKFLAICEAQGGFREPSTAAFSYDIVSDYAGKVIEIDNRCLALVAKLAGAPHDPAAGIEFFAKQETYVDKGQLLYRIHAESKGELDYALNYAKSIPDVIKIDRNT